jgi:hypothetical protein
MGAIVSIHVTMSKTEHSPGAAHRSIRCTFGPVRDVDLVWPPTDEDIDAFSIVHMDEHDARTPRAEPSAVEAAATSPISAETIPAETIPADPARSEAAPSDPAPSEPAVRRSPRRIKPTFGDCRARDIAPRVRPLVVPMVPLEPPPLPESAVVPEPVSVQMASTDTPVANDPAGSAAIAPAEATPFATLESVLRTEPEPVAAHRSAWTAGFLAAACLLVTVVEYRAATILPVAAEAPPALPPHVAVAEVQAPAAPASAVPAPRPTAPAKPAIVERTAAVVPARPTPEPKIAPAPERKPAPAPAPAPPPRLAATVPTRNPETTRATPPVRPEPTPALAARIDARPPVAPARIEAKPDVAPARVEARIVPSPTSGPVAAAAPPPANEVAPRPEPFANTAPAASVSAAVLTDPRSDEADIRSTLTRFRTAYSQLNASAARDVWPSVDTRALERAFQSLKSQDLRFDSCTMTVTGARAQAACKGRATYVPRIGDQSPRFTAREWNFELRKADERWTIASARSL